MAYACSTSSFPPITRSDDALRVDFYHLTRTPVEFVLPRLLEKVVSGGERALVVAGDAGLLARLLEQLWRYEPASFLPHSTPGWGDEAATPILPGTRAQACNGAPPLHTANSHWQHRATKFEHAFFAQ